MSQRVRAFRRFIVTAGLLLSASLLSAQDLPTILVNCNAGQSLNAILSKLPKNIPVTVLVQGTCTEYVKINGFEGLTLKAAPGAVLQQPGTTPPGGVASLLLISASRSVTINGFAIHTTNTALGGVSIGQNSNDIRLRNLIMDGPATFGVFVFEASQVSVANVTVRDFGFAGIAALDVCDVHIERSTIKSTTGSPFHDGIFASGGGHVTVQSTTIRNMQVGISAADHGIVDIQSFTTYFPKAAPDEVVIDSPAGTSVWGVEAQGGSAIQVGDTKLQITNPGRLGGSDTGAVFVTDGSTLTDQGGHLLISGSKGQGLLVSNNSHATVSGSSVTGGAHGGLVVANLSTIEVQPGGALTVVGGNALDLFCDSKSLISGTSNLAGVPTANCGSLLPGDTEPLP